MPRKRQKEKAEKANTEDEASKNRGQTPDEKLLAQTFDEYQCSGNVEIDFPQLCALLDIKDIPAVSTRQQSSSNTETEGADVGVSQSQKNALWSKRRLQVELENDDPFSAKSLKISGWRVDEQMTQVLQRMLPSLSKLQSLQFWQAGLTDRTVTSLMNTISLCANLSSVVLEGNPLPERSYHLLLSEDSVLTHLSLRNNRIGDEGSRLIGSALSTTTSANKNLLSLNLSFNSIGDAGAKHIAQGLRLNRALLLLSLSNNQIGDAGAAHLAATLGEFALTHEEVVERRKLLLERTQSSLQSSFVVDSERSPVDQLPSVPSSSSLSGSKGKKKEVSKKGERRENPKSNKKSSDVKVPQSKVSRPVGKEKQVTAQEGKSSASLMEQGEEAVNALLDPSVQSRDGELLLPGNTSLVSLNLAASDVKVPQSKVSRPVGKEKQVTAQEGKSSTILMEQGEEAVNALLDPSVQSRDGELLLPGNTSLISLNLAGNRITEKSLPLFLKSLQMQSEAGDKGLLRLCLQRNSFPSGCESYAKILELMKLERSARKSNSEHQEEEGQGA